MREEDGLETAESFNQTQCSKNNEGACTVSRRMLACKYKCVYTCILSFSNVFLKITFPLHMGCCVRSACDLMCCSVVTSGDQSSRVWTAWSGLEAYGNPWIWALGKMTVPSTQIRFDRMFCLNELWVLMVEQRMCAYMHTSMWLCCNNFTHRVTCIFYGQHHLSLCSFSIYISFFSNLVLFPIFISGYTSLNCCWMLRNPTKYIAQGCLNCCQATSEYSC